MPSVGHVLGTCACRLSHVCSPFRRLARRKTPPTSCFLASRVTQSIARFSICRTINCNKCKCDPPATALPPPRLTIAANLIVRTQKRKQLRCSQAETRRRHFQLPTLFATVCPGAPPLHHHCLFVRFLARVARRRFVYAMFMLTREHIEHNNERKIETNMYISKRRRSEFRNCLCW